MADLYKKIEVEHLPGIEKDYAFLVYMGYRIEFDDPEDLLVDVFGPFIYIHADTSKEEKDDIAKVLGLGLKPKEYTLLCMDLAELDSGLQKLKSAGYLIFESQTWPDQLEIRVRGKMNSVGWTVNGSKTKRHSMLETEVREYVKRLKAYHKISDDDSSGIEAQVAILESFEYPATFDMISETGVHNIKFIDQAVRFLEHAGYKLTPINKNKLAYQITGKFKYMAFEDMKDINVQNILDFIGLDKNQVWASRYFFTSDREVQQVHDILEKDYKVLKIGVHGWRTDVSLKSDRPKHIAYIYGILSNENFAWHDEQVIQYARRLSTELNISDDDFAGIDSLGLITESETIPTFDAWLKTVNK